MQARSVQILRWLSVASALMATTALTHDAANEVLWLGMSERTAILGAAAGYLLGALLLVANRVGGLFPLLAASGACAPFVLEAVTHEPLHPLAAYLSQRQGGLGGLSLWIVPAAAAVALLYASLTLPMARFLQRDRDSSLAPP